MELPELPWQSVREGFGKLRVVGEKLHLNHVLQEGPKDALFNKIIGNKLLIKFHYISENFHGSSSL